MQILKIAFSLSALALFGCASNQQAMDRSFAQADSSKNMAAEANIDSVTTAKASAYLDSAKVYKDNGDEVEAISAADFSYLEYRAAMVNAERDSLKKEDARIEKELRSDVERKILYQSILDQETKGAK